MKQIFFVLLVVAFGFGCSPTGNTAREVKRETRDQRKAPVILSAKGGALFFNMRESSFFDYLENSELYAGTYTQKGDSLLLGFHNNYQPSDLTGKALINRSGGELVLFSKDPARNRRLAILQK